MFVHLRTSWSSNFCLKRINSEDTTESASQLFTWRLLIISEQSSRISRFQIVINHRSQGLGYCSKWYKSVGTSCARQFSRNTHVWSKCQHSVTGLNCSEQVAPVIKILNANSETAIVSITRIRDIVTDDFTIGRKIPRVPWDGIIILYVHRATIISCLEFNEILGVINFQMKQPQSNPLKSMTRWIKILNLIDGQVHFWQLRQLKFICINVMLKLY